VSDRLLRRHYKVNGTTQSDTYYGYTSAADSPAFVTDGSGTVVQKYLSLPGGVNVTIKPQSTSAGAVTYSLSNLHGDTMATVNADGLATLQAPTGPYGELLVQPPTNTVDDHPPTRWTVLASPMLEHSRRPPTRLYPLHPHKWARAYM